MTIERLDFAYGTLAASTRHKPMRSAFQKLALEGGMTLEQFEAWASTKTWER